MKLMSEQSEVAGGLQEDQLSLVERALVIIGLLRGAIGKKGKRERVADLREGLIELLADAQDAELYQIAVNQLRACEESLDDGFESTLERLKQLRDTGRAAR